MKTVDRKLIERKFKECKKKWKANKGKNRDAHEFYKGQFLVLRSILYPEKYDKETVNNRNPLS